MGVLLHVHGTGAQATHECTWDLVGDRSGIPTIGLQACCRGVLLRRPCSHRETRLVVVKQPELSGEILRGRVQSLPANLTPTSPLSRIPP